MTTLLGQIPEATEQGNSAADQGKFSGDQGIRDRARVSVHFSHTCGAALRWRSVLAGNFAGEVENDGGPLPIPRALRRGLLARAPRSLVSQRVESTRIL